MKKHDIVIETLTDNTTNGTIREIISNLAQTVISVKGK